MALSLFSADSLPLPDAGAQIAVCGLLQAALVYHNHMESFCSHADAGGVLCAESLDDPLVRKLPDELVLGDREMLPLLRTELTHLRVDSIGDQVVMLLV